MALWDSYRFQAAVSFVASLYTGYSIATREESGKHLARTVVMNVVATAGILVGYALADRFLGR